MAFDYGPITLEAQQIIEDFGRDITIRTNTVTPGAQPGRGGTNVIVDTTLKAVFDEYSDENINGTSVLIGDKSCLFSAVGISIPDTDDTILDGGDTWRIIKVTPVQTGEPTIIYQLQLRR